MLQDESETPVVYVIAWKWCDGSGYGVAAAHHDRQRAIRELDRLKEASESRFYTLHEVPLES